MDTNYQQMHFDRRCRHSKNNRYFFGAIIVLIGLFILSKRLGLFFFPVHIWPYILIAIGLYTGVRNQFRNFGSWVLIALGLLFAIPHFFVFGVLTNHLIGPVLIILLGVYLILQPNRRYYRQRQFTNTTLDEDYINLNVSFGEKSSFITSKNFKGGIINNTFGNAKVNLMQADSNEPMVLDMHVSFGAVDLLIPSHWELQLQVENSFSNIEDKRYMRVVQTEDKKILTIKGNCSFGAITVKSL